MSLLSKTLKGTYATVRRLPAIVAATAAGWIGYSALRDRPEIPLPDPFASNPDRLATLEAGLLATHESAHTSRDHEATPVLLIHSVNAAASSYEVAPLFQRMERDRFTVAMDLPGFGHSERGDRDYTPELMADGIAAVLGSFDRPVHVVALSLASEFAARAARIRPDRIRSLTFISPSGMGSGSRIDPAEETRYDAVLDNALIGQAVFDLLVTDWSIRYFLSKSFTNRVDPGLAAFASLTGRQSDARYAPIAFLKGRLFTPDALSHLYQPLVAPALVLYDEDPYVDFAYLPEFIADGNQRWAERIVGTRGLPHFERPAATLDAIGRFWKDVDNS